MVYRRGRRFYFTISDPKTPGEYLHLATGTHDEPTAEAIEAMWLLIGSTGRRWHDLTDAVLEGRCKLGRLYDHYIAGTLEQLRAELTDVDLAPGVQAWDAQLEDQYRGQTPRKYRHHIAALFPRDGKTYRAMPRSRLLAPGFIAGKLADVGSSRTNRRRHFECWSAGFDFLVDRGYLGESPMRMVKKPKPDASRTPHLDRYEDVLRLVHAFPEGEHRAIAALREGAGMEMQAVLAMRARDVVSIEERIVWAHGSKNDWRDRQVTVDAECFDVFLAFYRSRHWHPDAPLFDAVSDDAHRRQHARVCEAMRAEIAIPARYSPHAARHTFAIRWERRAVEEILIANQLGHRDASLVHRLYGRYRPMVTDIKRAKAQEGR